MFNSTLAIKRTLLIVAIVVAVVGVGIGWLIRS